MASNVFSIFWFDSTGFIFDDVVNLSEIRYWDDWVREPEQRKGRVCIRPEISRTYTFGEVGVSIGQFWREYLSSIKLNDQLVPWSSKDLDYLMKVHYCP
jgi:alpha-1,3-mannosyl-glycoprotein beta-1,2-N-acetylglucosaminyltransferase